MFVYRFQYDNGKGLYNHNISCNDRAYRKADHLCNVLRRYSSDCYFANHYDPHPRFSSHFTSECLFGFDSIPKFEVWFPEQLLKRIVRIKSRRLKFYVFDVDPKYVDADKNQCVFLPYYTDQVVSCHMGCINFDGMTK